MTESVIGNVLRRGTIACLFGVICLFGSISSAEPKMKLEKLVQKLDTANPLTVEKIESIFGAKFTQTFSNDVVASYAGEAFVFEEKLIITEVEFRFKIATNEMSRLIVRLSNDAGCFTLDRIKKTYPDTQLGPYGLSGSSPDAKFAYWTERPWGHIAFSFKVRRPECLAGIIFIPKGKE